MTRGHVLIAAVLLLSAAAFPQTTYINTIDIPDVAGYRTLKCDFHMHTVFSDGDVWPTFRVKEAVLGGLDAIALTDHLEYQPKSEYVSKDRNAPFKLAQKDAATAGLILIPGAEITRSMPPGHLNAIFVQDANALVKETWKDAVDEATKQGALIFWNHPGWGGQQPDHISRWYDEHTYLLSSGILKGIEIANHIEYYPDVFAWCLEKNVALLGNSDSHAPIDFEFGTEPERLRPITLVFARERSAESIKEAILERRTAVMRGKELFGEERWLKEIFEKSISFSTKSFTLTGKGPGMSRVTNHSDLPYTLVLVQSDSSIWFPPEIELSAGRTALFMVHAQSNSLTLARPVTATYEVKNLFTAPGKALRVVVAIDVVAKPKD